MEHAMATPFAGWVNFYVIVGSSAGALTGLQFIVIVLGANSNVVSGTTTRAFASPTIVHFCGVLLVSALLCAPWHAVASASACLMVIGFGGVAYVATILKHVRTQNDYVPEFEDWLCHFVLPFLAYLTIALAALALWRNASAPMFAIGGAALLLLFVGIHNAWDAVLYIASRQRQGSSSEADQP